MHSLIRKNLEYMKKDLNLQISDIQEQMSLSPLQEIVSIDNEFELLVNEYQGDKRFSKEFLDKLKSISKRRKAAFKKAMKPIDYSSLINRQVDLEAALKEVINMLYQAKKQG